MAQSYKCLVTNPAPYAPRSYEIGAIHTEVVVLIPVTRGLFDVFLGDDRLGECEEADLRAFLKERGVESSTPKLIEKPDGGLKMYNYPAPKSGKKKSNAKKKSAKKANPKRRKKVAKKKVAKKKTTKKKTAKKKAKKNPSKKNPSKKKAAKKNPSKKNPSANPGKKKKAKKKATKKKGSKKAAPRKEKKSLTPAQIDRALRNSGFNI